MKTMLKIFFLLFGFLLISCSDDPIKEPSTDENGGIVSRYQMVRINMESTPLSQDVYDGTFNNKSIKLSKVDDNELVFYVHETTPLGENLLSIPALANKRIFYEVKDVILTQSVQETIQPLMTDLQEFSTTLTSDPVDLPFVQNHNAMMTYYNGLTDAEKAEVAKFYKVNKDIIDAIYNTDYSAIQGKASSADFDFPHYRKLVNCYKASLAVAIIGAAVAVAEPSKLISPIALGVAIGGAKSAIDFHHQIQTEVYTVIEVNVNGWFGDNNKQSNTLAFNDNQTMTFPFSLNNRNIVNSDASSSKEFMALFFATKNGVNNLIDNINIGLTWVNNNVPFISFSMIPNVSVSATSSGVLKNVNTAAMQRISFSVNHPNLSLENATLSGTGQLSLKIKIVGTPSSTPISSTLNYSYSDDFSSFSGSFPIEVSTNLSILQSLNLINKTDVSTCLGPDSYSCNYQHEAIFSGASPIGGALKVRTFWDNDGDNYYEGSTGYISFSIQSSNISQQGNNFIATGFVNGYCWGNPLTQLKIEYYYVSANGVESPHYFSGVSK